MILAGKSESDWAGARGEAEVEGERAGGGGGGDLEKHCGRTRFRCIDVSIDIKIDFKIAFKRQRLCQVKGRGRCGTWAEPARATSRSFATFLFFRFQLSLSLSLSLSL